MAEEATNNPEQTEQQTEQKVEQTQEQKPATKTRKVAGKTREYTEAEWDSAAERWLAGDNTLREAKEFKQTEFQEVAAARKELGEDAEIVTLLRTVRNNDAKPEERIAAYRKVGPWFGKTEEQINAELATFQQQMQGGPVQQTQTQPQQTQVHPQQAEFNREMAQRTMQLEEHQRVYGQDYDERAEAQGKELVKQLVNEDPELQKYTKNGGTGAEAIYEMATEAIQEVGKGKKQFGPDDLRNAFSKVRARCKALNIPTTKPLPGFAGYGPGVAGPTYSLEKAPEPKPGDLENFTQRMDARRAQGETL